MWAFTVRFSLVAIIALFLLPSDSQAGEGHRPIYQPIVIGPGDEGKNTVTRNITAASTIIHVLAGTGMVDIDLNGFSLDAEFNPIQVDGAEVFKVRNGDLAQGGVRVSSTQRVVIEDLTISPGEATGISLLNVPKFAVRRNIISAGEPAMNIDTAISGVIEDNVLNGGDAAMQLYDLENVDVARNRIDRGGDVPGILVRGCQGCRFADNLIRSSIAHGLDFGDVNGSRISGNVVTGVTLNGIVLTALSNYNLIFENMVTDSGGVGILVEGVGNFIDRNLLSGNASWGLHLTGIDNIYKGNAANNNGGTATGCAGSGPATTDLCDATSGGNLSPLNQPPTLVGDNMMPDPR